MSMATPAEEMIPIPLKEFISSSVMPVDVYIRLANNKYICIAKEDSPIPADRLASYENHRVDCLYVLKADYHRYTASNLMIADVIINRSEIAAAKKAHFMHKSAMSVMKEIELLGLRPESYDHARQIAQGMTQLVESKVDLFSIMESIAQLSDELLAHSIAVSTISLMIAHMQGWTKKGTFEKLALGALLHDVGLKQLPKALLEKPRSQMSHEEVVLFESHTFKGMEILRTIPAVPDDIIAIVYEHHENSLGQGYPRKIRDMKLNPLARVVGLADAFVELTLKNINCPEPKSPADAVMYIENVMAQPFNRECFTALRLLVKTAKKSSDAA
jgi:putative nucleotidyltransferase with HDIG domain